MAATDQDHVVEDGLAAVLPGEQVVGVEGEPRGAAGVATVPVALVERAELRVRRAACDAGVDEVAPVGLDREAAGVAGEPLGGLGADRTGALDEGRLVGGDVHDQRRAAARWPGGGTSLCERDERVGGRLLPARARCRRACRPLAASGDVADRLLEDDTVLEREPATDRELTVPVRPDQAQLAAAVERLVVGRLRRCERPRHAPDLAGRLPDRGARERAIRLGRRELRRRSDLVERQRAGLERVVELGQLAQACCSSS